MELERLLEAGAARQHAQHLIDAGLGGGLAGALGIDPRQQVAERGRRADIGEHGFAHRLAADIGEIFAGVLVELTVDEAARLVHDVAREELGDPGIAVVSSSLGWPGRSPPLTNRAGRNFPSGAPSEWRK